MLRKNKLLKQFLLTYLLVIIIILGTMLFVFRAVINVQLEGLEEAQMVQIDLLEEEMREQVAQYKELAALISGDSKMAKSWIALNHYNAYEALVELKKYNAKCMNTESIALFFLDDYLYTSSGCMDIDTYMTRTQTMRMDSRESFLQSIYDNRENFCMVSCENGQKLLYYHCPIPVNDPNPHASVNFQLNIYAFEDKIKTLLKENAGYACLTLPDGTVIVETGDSTLFSEVMGRAVGEAGTAFSFRKGGIGYRYQSRSIDALNLTYHIIMNTAQITAPVDRIWRLGLMAVFIIFLLSVGISYLLSLYNYHPIHVLYQGIVSLPKTEKGETELDTIQKVLLIASNENLSLHNMVKESHFLMREQALQLLFKGDVQGENAARRMLEFLHMEVPMLKLYAVAVVDAEEKDLQVIAETAEWSLHFFLQFNERNVLCVALSAEDAETAMEQLDAETLRIRSQMGENGLHARIGVGQAYDQNGRMRRSMNEALAALDQCAPGETAFFAKLTNMQFVESGFDEKVRNALANAIKNRDAEAMCRCLGDMTCELRTGVCSDEMRSFLLYDLVHIVLNSLTEMQLDQQYVDELMHMNTANMEQFIRDMQSMFGRIAQEKTEERSNMRLYRIMAFLRENFRDPTLSVENVAERFNMTRSYLSRLFKEETGSTYIEFLSSLRLEEAKRMLRETEMSTQDILQSVGYHDAASFHRKFKQMTGMTPAAYRDANNKKT